MELAAAAVAKAKRYEKPDPMGQEASETETGNAASLTEVHKQAGDGDKGKEDDGESAKIVSRWKEACSLCGIVGTSMRRQSLNVCCPLALAHHSRCIFERTPPPQSPPGEGS